MALPYATRHRVDVHHQQADPHPACPGTQLPEGAGAGIEVGEPIGGDPRVADDAIGGDAPGDGIFIAEPAPLSARV